VVAEGAGRHRNGDLVVAQASLKRPFFKLLAFGTILGGALAIAFPPYDLPLLGLLALPAMVAIGVRVPPSSAAAVGLVAGLSFFSLYLRWLSVLGWYALAGAVLVQALFFSAFFYLLRRISRGHPLSFAPAAGGVWAVLESLRGAFPFGGFPWATLGSSLHDVPSARRLASIVGTSGLSVLLVVASCFAATFFMKNRCMKNAPSSFSQRIFPAAMFTVVLAGSFALPDLVTSDRTITVGLVQAGIEMPVFVPADPEEVLERHIRATRTLAGRDLDLVLWGEGVVDSEPSQVVLSQLAREIGIPIAAGAMESDVDGFLNLVIATDGERELGRYSKQHPVPFGEYVPWRWLFGQLPVLAREIPVDMKRGDHFTLFNYGSVVAAPVISFESTYPSMVREAASPEVELLQVHTNNSTFGRGPTSVQHLSLDQMRAAELGVPVLRSAITGISAVIDANGRVLDRLEIFESGVIVSEVSIPSGTTLYRRFGELLFTLPLMLWGGSYAAARLLTPSRRPDRFVR
jgi:apolipoprotein N-acyltransferase